MTTTTTTHYDTKPMPLLPITSPETVKLCHELPSQPSDIFICSYPKSGTTWTQHIVLSLLLAAADKKQQNGSSTCTSSPSSVIEAYSHVSDYAPFYEVDAHWDLDERNLIQDIRNRHEKLGRRVFNTHLRWDMLPHNNNNDKAQSTTFTTQDKSTSSAKYIYIVRSPLDACVSFFHHLSNQIEGRYENTFEKFYTDWIRGDIAFGRWVDHVLSFVPAVARNSNVLLLSYDNLLNDLAGEVDRIVDFLGIDVSDADQRDLLPTFAFDYMKSGDNLAKFQPKSVTWRDGFQFLRKGVSGDSDALMNDVLRGEFDAMLRDAEFQDRVSACFDSVDDDPCLRNKKVILALGDRKPK